MEGLMAAEITRDNIMCLFGQHQQHPGVLHNTWTGKTGNSVVYDVGNVLKLFSWDFTSGSQQDLCALNSLI